MEDLELGKTRKALTEPETMSPDDLRMWGSRLSSFELNDNIRFYEKILIKEERPG